MATFIHLSRACSRGLAIMAEKVSAWSSHSQERMEKVTRAEAEHLKVCAECNPELETNALLESLWPGAKVQG